MSDDYFYYDIWRWFLSAMVDVFFREVQTRGLHKTPETGPIFFVAAPHCNQFFDPLVLNRHCHRRIMYLCAKKSYDKAVVGRLARGIRSIPVARAQDYAFKATGKIKVLDRYKEPTKITGIGTKFSSDIKPGMILALPKGDTTTEVESIISDTELIITKEFKSLSAISMLERAEGVSFKVAPHFDQSKVYDEVHETLKAGECVGIFPEGGSHDRTELLPLKAGIAVMALGAMSANPSLDVKIVPCGMHYFHPDRFRSRAVIDYGAPFSIPKEIIEQFKLGGEDKRAACGQLMGMISESLKVVTITTPDYETLMVAQAARRLYRSPVRKNKISQVVKFNRLLVEGYLHFKDDPRVVQLRAKILSYNERLRQFGIRDHQVKTAILGKKEATFKFIKRTAIAAVYGLLTLPALILNFPIIALCEIVSKRKQAEALATSTVKITARDVVSSWKLVISLGVGPAVYLGYSILAAVLFSKTNYSIIWKLLAPFITFLTIPVLSYYCLIFGDKCYDIYRSLQPLFLIMTGNNSVPDLVIEREELSKEITYLVNELGYQLFPDFGKESPETSSSVPPLTPSSQSALNWIMSPLDFVGEKFFDFATPSSSRPSSRAPSRSTSTNDLAGLMPFSKLEPLNPAITTDPSPGSKKTD